MHAWKEGVWRAVTAEKQTAGRGQQEKKWFSPANCNIYATLHYFDKTQLVDIQNINNIITKATVTFLSTEGVEATIKRPNDVLVKGKKIAGILLETRMEPDGTHLIVGVGLNINMGEKECHMIEQPVTSLALESGKVFIYFRVSLVAK